MCERETIRNIHPGEILSEDFLKPMGITPYRLAKDIGVGRVRISEVIRGHRDVTADTAIRLGLYFGIEPEFWLNLQARYNLVEARTANPDTYSSIVRANRAAA
jgi:antitoxin HigA-1